MESLVKSARLWTFFIVLGVFFLQACGQIRLGGTINDAVPSGNIVASGNFVGTSGQSASGAVEIYQTGTNSYVLRLDGVSFPNEGNLEIILNPSGTGSGLVVFPLRASTGNQNYSFSTSSTPTFSLIALYSTAKATNYATASLTSH